MGFDMDLDRLIEKLETVADAAGEGAGHAVKEVAKKIFDESQVRVPKLSLALMQSGKIVPGEDAGMTRSETIHYGDSDTDRVGVYYAAAVHEILSHEHEAPTGPKYVEGPMLEAIPEFRDKLAKEVGDRVKEHFK